jgi:flagellar motor switch/type III secretory pathway protein FliN
MNAMSHIAQSFSRSARRALPFLVRRRARLLPQAVSIVETTLEEQESPIYEVLLASEDGPAWGRVTLNTSGLAMVLEGALGGAAGQEAAELGAELTLAQKALVSRIARSLGEDLAQALKEQVGLTLNVISSHAVAAGDVGEPPGSDGLEVDCRFEGSEDAAILIAVSAEALQVAARDSVDEEPSHGDPRMAEALHEVQVQLVVELGTTEIGLKRLLTLKPGQVLRLATALDDPVLIRIAGITKFAGAPVVSRGQLSVELRGRRED